MFQLPELGCFGNCQRDLRIMTWEIFLLGYFPENKNTK